MQKNRANKKRGPSQGREQIDVPSKERFRDFKAISRDEVSYIA